MDAPGQARWRADGTPTHAGAGSRCRARCRHASAAAAADQSTLNKYVGSGTPTTGDGWHPAMGASLSLTPDGTAVLGSVSDSVSSPAFSTFRHACRSCCNGFTARVRLLSVCMQRSSLRVSINFDGTWSRIGGYAVTGTASYSAAGNPAVGGFISDSQYLVRAVDLTTSTVQVLAGSNVKGYTGDDGPALAARVSSITSIIPVYPDIHLHGFVHSSLSVCFSLAHHVAFRDKDCITVALRFALTQPVCHQDHVRKPHSDTHTDGFRDRVPEHVSDAQRVSPTKRHE